MSWQATAWAVRQKTGSAGCKLLLLTLANYADDTGCCWPGQDTLKNDTEQSLDTIQRQLKKLETLGLVRKVPRPMGPGRWSSRTYFLNMTAGEMTKPQSAAWSEDDATGRQPTEPTWSERNDGVTPAVQSMPQGTWDHAAADPVTMPHQARDHAAPVRHEPSLEPLHEPSLEASSSSKPKKPKPSATERQKAFSQGRKGVEIIQNRIARKLGSDGWEILQELNEADLHRITTMEERGHLDAAALEFVRLRYRQSAA
jgi:Helix-turn-helix domain